MATWDEAVSVAAKWWADHLRADHAPSRDAGNLPEPPIADEEFTDVIRTILTPDKAQEYIDTLAAHGAKKPNLTPEQVDLFERKLRRVLHWAMFFEFGVNPYRARYLSDMPLHVGVDYHPDDYLTLAAMYSDMWGRYNSGIIYTTIEPHVPWKTHMWITPYSVSVREGYSGEQVVIWQHDAALTATNAHD